MSARTRCLHTIRSLLVDIVEQTSHIAKQNMRTHRQMEMIMSNQEQLDQRVAALGAQTDALVSGFDEVQNELAALKETVEQGQPVDFTGLDAALGNLGAAVGEVSDEVPDAEPPPEPESEPG